MAVVMAVGGGGGRGGGHVCEGDGGEAWDTRKRHHHPTNKIACSPPPPTALPHCTAPAALVRLLATAKEGRVKKGGDGGILLLYVCAQHTDQRGNGEDWGLSRLTKHGVRRGTKEVKQATKHILCHTQVHTHTHTHPIQKTKKIYPKTKQKHKNELENI